MAARYKLLLLVLSLAKPYAGEATQLPPSCSSANTSNAVHILFSIIIGSASSG
ncbi:hypothetical protein [Providencia sp. TYF-12]|uniref:hypothetical protein n=1 Tax=Providencia sp. TYF-12 TaxID=3151124 RepID=UPI0035249209